MAPNAQAQWSGGSIPASWVPAVAATGWGRPPEPEPPLRRLDWPDYLYCFLILFGLFALAVEFRGFLLDDEYSVVNVLALVLARIHMLLMKMKPSPAPAASNWTALALLPTCPAPAALHLPPVCDEWEKPAVAMVLPATGSADTNWLSYEHKGDYKAAKKCFDSLVLNAAWTCDEQKDDYEAAMKCFDSLLSDAARICFVWSYDAIPLTHQFDDPPPT